jgi:hypothetical protein
MEKWVKRGKRGIKKGSTLGFFKLSGCRIAKHYKRRAFLLKKYSLGGGQSTRRSVFHENHWIPASAGMTGKGEGIFFGINKIDGAVNPGYNMLVFGLRFSVFGYPPQKEQR